MNPKSIRKCTIKPAQPMGNIRASDVGAGSHTGPPLPPSKISPNSFLVICYTAGPQNDPDIVDGDAPGSSLFSLETGPDNPPTKAPKLFFRQTFFQRRLMTVFYWSSSPSPCFDTPGSGFALLGAGVIYPPRLV